jgi:hypothetical protein
MADAAAIAAAKCAVETLTVKFPGRVLTAREDNAQYVTELKRPW